MSRLLLLCGVLSIVGCASASLVQSVYEPTKGGVVKYKNALVGGAASAEKAQTIMANFCAPSAYSIIQQQASTETVGYNAQTTGRTSGTSYGNMYNGSYSGNTQVTPVNRNYVYVQFRCGEGRATASTPGQAVAEGTDFNSCNNACYQNYASQKADANSCYEACGKKYGK